MRPGSPAPRSMLSTRRPVELFDHAPHRQSPADRASLPLRANRLQPASLGRAPSARWGCQRGARILTDTRPSAARMRTRHVLARRRDGARRRTGQAQFLFERLLALGSPLGLFAEEADPVTGSLLSNYPQAFTHHALVGAAVNIERARKRHTWRNGTARACCEGPNRSRGADLGRCSNAQRRLGSHGPP
jgi:hypothetical protein